MSQAHFWGGLNLLLNEEDTAPLTTWVSWGPRKSLGGRVSICTLPVLPSGGTLPLISRSPSSSTSRQAGRDMYVENPCGVDSHMPTVSMN